MESLECLAFLSPVLRGGFPVIERVKGKPTSNALLVSTGNQFLYLFEEGQLLLTFKFSAGVVCVDFTTQDECFVVTTDGRLWFVDVTKETKQLKRGKSHDCDESKNQEIFADLLGNNVCDGTFVDRQTDSIKQVHPAGCLPSGLVTVPLSDAVLYKPGVQSVFPLSSSTFITGGVTSVGYCVSVHRKHGLDHLEDSSKQQRPITISTLCQSSIPGFMSAKEPLLSQPVLMCVCPSVSMSSSKMLCSLDRAVFEQLFGSELSLIDSPILLLGTCEGYIYYFPLSGDVTGQCVTIDHKSKPPPLLKTKTGVNNCGISLVPSLLYCLEQPVSAIFIASIPFVATAANDKKVGSEQPKTICNNCILFVGKTDKIMVTFQDKSSVDTRKAVFAECQIPGPVLCSVLRANNNVLVHSTGKEVFISEVEVQDSQLPSKDSVPQVTVTTIHYIKVPLVCVMDYMYMCVTSHTDSFIVLTSRGKLLKLSISKSHDGSSFSPMRISSQVAGGKMKCLLSDIERISKQLSQVNLSITIEDKILKDINIATRLACELLDKQSMLPEEPAMPTDGSKPTQGIQCSVTPTIRDAGKLTSPLVNLTCKIINHGALTFGKGWSLLIQVRVSKPGVQPVVVHNTASKALPLHTSATGQQYELDFPIQPVVIFYPVMVKFCLHFDLNSILSDLIDSVVLESVAIPLDVKMLDMIDFLRPLHSVTSRSLSSPHFQSNMQEVSPHHRLLATVKNIGCSFGSQNVNPGPTTTPTIAQPSSSQSSCHASLHLSQSCVWYIYQHVQINKHTYSCKDSVTLEQALLRFITASSKAFLEMDSTQCSVEARSPAGEHIELCVCRSAARSDRAEDCCAFQLVLKAPSVELMCSLHEAVLVRLKTVIQRSLSQEEQVQCHHFQEMLGKVKSVQHGLIELEKELGAEQKRQRRAVCDNTTVTSSHLPATTGPRLVQLYQELRQNTIPIP